MNEWMNEWIDLQVFSVHMQAKLDQGGRGGGSRVEYYNKDNTASTDTRFEIRTLVVWSLVRHLSVM